MTRLFWLLASVVGAAGWGVIALHRGETISAAWLVLAAVGTYLVAYRFYSRFLAERVFALDGRATPAERLGNGRDFVPTTKWVLFGHHFAAIAGAGPLVGPVLAAQFGWLPSTIWIVFGVVLGGAVQDFVILFGSMRRNGTSLGQMARDEIGPVTGSCAAPFGLRLRQSRAPLPAPRSSPPARPRAAPARRAWRFSDPARPR